MREHNKRKATIDVSDIQKLTPRTLLGLCGRLSVISWFMIFGLNISLILGAFDLGFRYCDGSLPEFAYLFQNEGETLIDRKKQREEKSDFKSNYSELVNWRILKSISAGIAKDHPDGLHTELEIATSLLAQVRATRGSAEFLAGEERIIVNIKQSDNGFELEWDNKPSIVRQIAKDAGYELTDEELSTTNSNLNWAQFSYLDDEMEHSVIYRDIDGSLGLLIRENP